jgi:WD40 repeat protein
MKRLSYKKNNKFANKRLSKIKGGTPPKQYKECKKIANFAMEENYITSVAFDIWNPLIITGSSCHTGKFWEMSEDFTRSTDYRQLSRHTGGINSIAVAPWPYENFIATGGDDNTIVFWKFKKLFAMEKLQLNEHTGPVTCVAFHPRSWNLMVSGSKDNTARLWDYNIIATASHQAMPPPVSCICIATFIGHSEQVNSAAFHPLINIIATASNDHTVKLWTCSSPGYLITTLDHNGPVTSVAFHRTLSLMASGSIDMTIKLWHFLPDRLVPICISTLLDHSSPVTSLAFHPGVFRGLGAVHIADAGNLLLTGSAEGIAKLWRISEDKEIGITATCVANIVGNIGNIRSVSFHPRLPILAISGNYVELWEY